MKLRAHILCIILTTIVSVSAAWGNEPQPDWRAFDSTEVVEWKERLDYEYGQAEAEEKISSNFFTRFLERFIDFLKSIFDGLENTMDPFDDERSSINLNFILMILIGLLILGAIVFLLKSQYGFIFNKRGSTILAYDIHDEDIRIIPFQRDIELAEQAQNYRTALRLRYLHVLQKLNEKELIRWEPQKTNYRYASELFQTPYQHTFYELSNWFDLVWYGQFMIDENVYASFVNIQTDFMQVLEKHQITPISNPS